MKRVSQLPPRVIVQKLLQRTLRAVDVPLSAVELRNLGICTERKTKYHERRVLRELRQCLRGSQGLVLYDIGAHTGKYAAAIASARSVRKVIAFEPIPDSFQQLERISKTEPKIQPINVALGDKRGSETFHLNESRASSSLLPMLPSHVEHFPHTARTKMIEVQVETLDRVVESARLELPDIIKLDVQGFEDRVIDGGQRTMQGATWCLVELSLVTLYDGAMTFDELYRKITGLGFHLSELTDKLDGKHSTALQINALFKRNA